MEYDAELSFTFAHTHKVIFGARAIAGAGDAARDLGGERVVVVTDRFLAEQTDLLERVKKALGPRLAEVFTGVEPDPSAPVIDAGADAARKAGADLLLSLGGGSAIDTAKAMAVVLTEGGRILDHEGYHNLERRLLPHLAVPTTAGTGSEMTLVTVVTDPDRGQKTFVGSHFLHPDAAILDPTLITGLPPKLTAATGMDAMSHAVEGLFSSLRNPLSDAYATEAVRLVHRWLPRSLAQPDDLVARGQMLLAANMAGTCFSNAMVSLNHAMAHSLGALYHVHHGTLNALLLPHTMRCFADVAASRLALVARAMGAADESTPDEQAAAAAADAMQAFVRDIGLTEGLAALGVPADGPAQAAEMALSDGAIIYSPKPVFDPDEIAQIIEKAM
jgi:alcohol dehydrogenase